APLQEVCSSASSSSLRSHAIDPTRDRFLLLCTDGVWEFMNSQQVVEAVQKKAMEDPMAAAEELAASAWDRWVHELRGEVVDDITVLVINLTKPSIPQVGGV
ncbi:unnamed protein product, partial [Polarella glacialis]